MKRRIGSLIGGYPQTPVIKRIRVTSVRDMRRCVATVFDRSTGRFESQGMNGNVMAGSFHVVNTNTSLAQNNVTSRRFTMSGTVFTMDQSVHGFDVSKPLQFNFSRRVLNEWVYDVSDIEVRVADSGIISVISSMDLVDVVMTISY